MAAMDWDPCIILSERLNNVAISDVLTTTAEYAESLCNFSYPLKPKKRPSSTLEENDTKIIRKDPTVAALHVRQEFVESQVFKEKEEILCRLVGLFPKNYLATISKSFCGASHLVFRQSTPENPFIRVWKDSATEGSGQSDVNFSDMLHYHPSLIKSQRHLCPAVREVKSILSFVTDVSVDLVYAAQLLDITILGYTDKVSLVTKSHDVQFAEKEMCFSSLFIPESDHFHVKTFSLPAGFSNKDLEAATNSKRQTGWIPDSQKQLLKAIFILQYIFPPIFHPDIFPLATRDAIVNGGVMSISNSNGADKDLAVGISIFGDTSVTVHLYGFDFSDENDFLFYKMQGDLSNKRGGFCIFLWCWKSYADDSAGSTKPESWETSSEEEERSFSNDFDFDDEKSTTNEEVSRVLKRFKKIVPNIPVIGCSTSHIMFNNGYQLSSRISASFLVLAF